MKKFLLKVGLLFALILILLTTFDVLFTSVYTYAKPRNKTQYLVNLKNKKIDYIFLGSSRVKDQIITKLVEKKTDKTALNLGIYNAKLNDIYLQLQLLVNNNIAFKKVFIQVDYSFNTQNASNIVESQALPYLRTNEVIRKQIQSINPKYLQYYYIPFYRYLDNDYIIGFRNFFITLSLNKKVDFSDDYENIYTKFNNETFPIPNELLDNNVVFDSIQSYCTKHKIEVVYFISPYCDDLAQNNFSKKLKNKIPGLKDYSAFLTDKKYFKDCFHLNADGAEIFTTAFIDDCLRGE